MGDHERVIVRTSNGYIFGAAVFMGISGIIGVVGAASAARGEPSGWVALGFALVGVLWGARGARTAVVITSRTVRVRNQWRSYTISRDEIVDFLVNESAAGFVPTAFMQLVRREGGPVPLGATTPVKTGWTYFTDTTRHWAIDGARERAERIRSAISGSTTTVR